MVKILINYPKCNLNLLFFSFDVFRLITCSAREKTPFSIKTLIKSIESEFGKDEV